VQPDPGVTSDLWPVQHDIQLTHRDRIAC
jgi:hypothetical protein